jgi:DNA-binding NarL/FixJ family response regulator
MKRPRVLLADDHLMVAEGLRSLLQGQFELVGIAANGYELMRMAGDSNPDVIVADFSMPGLNGIDAVRILKQQGSQAKCILLTMHADRALAMQAFTVGAVGYVLKHSAGRELLRAIQGALRGKTFVSPSLKVDPLFEMKHHRMRVLGLSSRQRQVLQLVAEGKSMKEVANQLGISTRTAETHKYRLMDVLGVRTTAELTQQAIKLRLIQVAEGVA